MNPGIKIGIQSLHYDEITALKELFDAPNVSIYSWNAHEYETNEIQSCDVLVLFARKHWRYMPLKKPYLLILADHVSERKAVDISKSRSLGLFGYRYKENDFFKGYLCGSEELLQAVRKNGVKGVFYPKKYPFAELYAALGRRPAQADARNIVSLINHYKYTASKRKWSRPENSYQAYKYVEQNSPGFHFTHFGAPHNQVGFDAAVQIQYEARYTIHIKYWGHVCNAVVKSLALGTPVIMDEATFRIGRYQSYVRHGQNGLVLKDKHEIVEYLKGESEETAWRRLKAVCVEEAPQWHFPYAEKQKTAGCSCWTRRCAAV